MSVQIQFRAVHAVGLPNFRRDEKHNYIASMNSGISEDATSADVEVADQAHGYRKTDLSTASQSSIAESNAEAVSGMDFTTEEHVDFVGAVFDIGIKSCSPTVIMELMRNERELRMTREIMKSHLQKYRKIKQRGKAHFLKDYRSFLGMLERTEKRQPETEDGEEKLSPNQVLKETLAGKPVRDVVGGDAAALLTYTVSRDVDLSAISTLNADQVEFPVLSETEKEKQLGKALSCVKGLMGFVGDHIQRERLCQSTDSDKINQLYSLLSENQSRLKRSYKARPKRKGTMPKVAPMQNFQTSIGYHAYQGYYPQGPSPLNIYFSELIDSSQSTVPPQNPQYPLYQEPYQAVPVVQQKTYGIPYAPDIPTHPLYQHHAAQCLPRTHHHNYYHCQGNVPQPYAFAPTLQPHSQPAQSTFMVRHENVGHMEIQKHIGTAQKIEARSTQSMHGKNLSMQSPHTYNYFDQGELEPLKARDGATAENGRRSPVGQVNRDMFHDEAFEPSHDPRLSRQKRPLPHPDFSVPTEEHHQSTKKLNW